jgi:hypothetical protein
MTIATIDTDGLTFLIDDTDTDNFMELVSQLKTIGGKLA